MTRPRNFSFSSLRFDFVLGYAAKYVKEYVDATVRHAAGVHWDTATVLVCRR